MLFIFTRKQHTDLKPASFAARSPFHTENDKGLFSGIKEQGRPQFLRTLIRARSP